MSAPTRKIEKLLATLPREVAEQLMEKMSRNIHHVLAMHQSGTDSETIKAYIRSDEAWS